LKNKNQNLYFGNQVLPSAQKLFINKKTVMLDILFLTLKALIFQAFATNKEAY
jgi:hypothetical protein